mmetsp:Transcript_2292/g.4536  ORF Transcript_2292/g.4536 Transcript_2292/m.4536 type:complete len:519 (+) Transcript_2292:182-1738(+)
MASQVAGILQRAQWEMLYAIDGPMILVLSIPTYLLAAFGLATDYQTNRSTYQATVTFIGVLHLLLVWRVVSPAIFRERRILHHPMFASTIASVSIYLALLEKMPLAGNIIFSLIFAMVQVGLQISSVYLHGKVHNAVCKWISFDRGMVYLVCIFYGVALFDNYSIRLTGGVFTLVTLATSFLGGLYIIIFLPLGSKTGVREFFMTSVTVAGPLVIIRCLGLLVDKLEDSNKAVGAAILLEAFVQGNVFLITETARGISEPHRESIELVLFILQYFKEWTANAFFTSTTELWQFMTLLIIILFFNILNNSGYVSERMYDMRNCTSRTSARSKAIFFAKKFQEIRQRRFAATFASFSVLIMLVLELFIVGKLGIKGRFMLESDALPPTDGIFVLKTFAIIIPLELAFGVLTSRLLHSRMKRIRDKAHIEARSKRKKKKRGNRSYRLWWTTVVFEGKSIRASPMHDTRRIRKIQSTKKLRRNGRRSEEPHTSQMWSQNFSFTEVANIEQRYPADGRQKRFI